MRKVLYILGDLDDADIEWLVRHARRRTLAPGATLIRQGEATDDLFILLEGRLAVSVEGLGEVARLGAGEIIGEMSFVDSLPPAATVTADGDALVLAIDKADMRAELRRNDGFAARFYRALAVFLSDRMRGFQTRQAGGAPGALAAEGALEDELDEGLLDTVSQAGESFTRMIRRLSQA